jgi:hypothetical protein
MKLRAFAYLSAIAVLAIFTAFALYAAVLLATFVFRDRESVQSL